MAKQVKVPTIPSIKPDWRVRDGFKPTRTFEIGEFVEFGNHQTCRIDEVKDGGVYKVTVSGVDTNYGNPKPYEKQYEVNWHMLYKLHNEEVPAMLQPEQFFMDHQRRDIMGVISSVLAEYAGIDFAPDYQRDYVWSLEDKQKLIDSIFNNITIGMIVLAKVPFKSDSKSYEVIDGKQRLTALVEFYEDRFQYKGYYYSQLRARDRNHFEGYPIAVGLMREPSEKEKYAAFLAVNTFGRVMNEDHLASVREKFQSL